MIELPGLCSFTGNCIHSHNYRSEEPYKDRTVLVIGGGPSGIDICNHLTKVAKKVIHTRQTRIKKIFDNCSQRTSTNSWHNHGFSIFFRLPRVNVENFVQSFLLRMKLTRFLISSWCSVQFLWLIYDWQKIICRVPLERITFLVISLLGKQFFASRDRVKFGQAIKKMTGEATVSLMN